MKKKKRFKAVHEVGRTKRSDEILRPIESLKGKTEKALPKLAPGTWQRKMLEENAKALRIAAALLAGEDFETGSCPREDRHAVRRALAAMIDKTEKAMVKFEPGTPHNTLQRNRLKSLRLAKKAFGARFGT